jgi:hypothetical protein
VDGVDVSDFSGADDAIGAKVTIGALGAADADRFIGQLHVQGLDVGLGIDGEGFYAQLSASTYDAQSNFTAIGDQYFLNHGRLGDNFPSPPESISRKRAIDKAESGRRQTERTSGFKRKLKPS